MCGCVVLDPAAGQTPVAEVETGCFILKERITISEETLIGGDE